MTAAQEKDREIQSGGPERRKKLKEKKAKAIFKASLSPEDSI
jgi:hypothetical protein